MKTTLDLVPFLCRASLAALCNAGVEGFAEDLPKGDVKQCCKRGHGSSDTHHISFMQIYIHSSDKQIYSSNVIAAPKYIKVLFRQFLKMLFFLANL